MTSQSPGETTPAPDPVGDQVRQVGTAMLRGGLVPGAVVAVVVVVVAVLLTGTGGLGTAVVAAAATRTESRGCHRRSDFPASREEWRRHLDVRLATDGEPVVEIA